MQVTGPYAPDAEPAGKRALANRCLSLLASASEEGLALAGSQFDGADNMTDMTFSLATDQIARAREALEAAQAEIGYKEIILDDGVSKVSIVGIGMGRLAPVTVGKVVPPLSMRV